MPKPKPTKSSDRPASRPAGSLDVTDPRFAHVHTDARFRRPSRDKSTVKIDDRFKRMFSDAAFSGAAATIDSRGKTTHQQQGEDLRRFYRLENDEEDGSDQNNELASDEDDSEDHSNGGSGSSEEEKEDNDGDEEGDEENNVQSVKSAAGLDDNDGFAVDYSRGEVLMSSSDDSDDHEADADDGEFADVWGGPGGHEHVEVTEETSRRLAICNMDWDIVTASDLYMLASSFKPAAGVIESVVVYPSEFGMQQMKREDVSGPGVFAAVNATSSAPLKKPPTNPSHQTDADGEGDQTALRAYELSRLRYFFAVVTCDSPSTAMAVYDQCDGLEYETSANVMDLRFIMDEVEFEQAPRDSASTMPAPGYVPKDFSTAALQHSKVKLTWDETDTKRLQVTKRKFNKDELHKMDFQDFLASDSGTSSDDDRTANAALLKGLVNELHEAEEAEKPKEDLEITWNIGLQSKVEDLIARKKVERDEKTMTIGELQVKKRKEKRKARKEELKKTIAAQHKQSNSGSESDSGSEIGGDGARRSIVDEDKNIQDTDADNAAELALLVADDDDHKHFNLKEIAKLHKASQKKSKKHARAAALAPADAFRVNVEDARFAALFNSSDYAIDPTRPEFMPTAEMQRVIAERQKRVHAADQDADPAADRFMPAKKKARNFPRK